MFTIHLCIVPSLCYAVPLIRELLEVQQRLSGVRCGPKDQREHAPLLGPLRILVCIREVVCSRLRRVRRSLQGLGHRHGFDAVQRRAASRQLLGVPEREPGFEPVLRRLGDGHAGPKAGAAVVAGTEVEGGCRAHFARGLVRHALLVHFRCLHDLGGNHRQLHIDEGALGAHRQPLWRAGLLHHKRCVGSQFEQSGFETAPTVQQTLLYSAKRRLLVGFGSGGTLCLDEKVHRRPSHWPAYLEQRSFAVAAFPAQCLQSQSAPSGSSLVHSLWLRQAAHVCRTGKPAHLLRRSKKRFENAVVPSIW